MAGSIRNYIIINGQNSSSINGLMICSLPPISKPQMRVSAEEIDGRDGDIITKLGYSAYNKPCEIALVGNYDVDEIIEFLNQDGIITFSNEPTKYYKFSQLAGIDFEKLIKFKTASVNFHCQPFKYALNEAEIVADFSISSSSGEVSVTNSGNYFSKPVIKITGTGNVMLNINENEIMELDMSEDSVIILDSTEMNAFAPDGTLLNRRVTGNFDDLIFTAGNNTLEYSGTVSQITVNKYSRWL